MSLDFDRYDEIERDLLGHARRYRERHPGMVGKRGAIVAEDVARETARGTALLYTKGTQIAMCSNTDCARCVLGSRWRDSIGVAPVNEEVSCDTYMIEGEADQPLRRLSGLAEIARYYGFLDTVIRKIMDTPNE